MNFNYLKLQHRSIYHTKDFPAQLQQNGVEGITIRNTQTCMYNVHHNGY